MNLRIVAWGMLVLVALLSVACAPSVTESHPEPAPVRGQLKEEEIRLARELAEEKLFGPESGLRDDEKICYTKTELLPASLGERIRAGARTSLISIGETKSFQIT